MSYDRFARNVKTKKIDSQLQLHSHNKPPKSSFNFQESTEATFAE
jgi:hypothetical protein